MFGEEISLMVLPETKERIAALKAERKAIILAHNYQREEVQELADHIGDSLELSDIAATTEAEVIVLCGVYFMAESAAALAPEKTILLPEKDAGCPLADMVTPEKLRLYKEKYPDAAVVTYINSSAAVKAESDVCVTSANAAVVVNSLDAGRILFIPDRNLAHFVSRQTDKEIIPWAGYCVTHQRVSVVDLQRARQAYPGAPVLVHPECRPEVVEKADAVLGTGGMLRYVKGTDAAEVVVGTEEGLLSCLRRERPDLKFHLLSPGLLCPGMKYTTADKILASLENMEDRVTVSPEIRERAAASLQRMLELSSTE